jgi:anaerobic ribonucleoside-triphosphate reductase activating protein
MKINHIAKCCEPKTGIKIIQIWTQGCTNKCEGCHSSDTWDIELGQQMTPEQIINEINFIGGFNAKEIHILGGEPLQQAKATIQLITRLKQYLDAKIKLLTGYTEQTIKTQYPELYNLCDIINTGRYDKTQEEWKK